MSEDTESAIRQEVAKLERFYPRITGCRVLVEAENRFASGEPVGYAVHIDLTLPQGEIPTTHQRDATLLTTVQRAFQAMTRQVEDFARIQRDVGAPKPRESQAWVVRMFPDEGYGFLETADGRELYFHKNSVLNKAFDRLGVGTEVRFAEEEGEKGPQASTVALASPGRSQRHKKAGA